MQTIPSCSNVMQCDDGYHLPVYWTGPVEACTARASNVPKTSAKSEGNCLLVHARPLKHDSVIMLAKLLRLHHASCKFAALPRVGARARVKS